MPRTRRGPERSVNGDPDVDELDLLPPSRALAPLPTSDRRPALLPTPSASPNHAAHDARPRKRRIVSPLARPSTSTSTSTSAAPPRDAAKALGSAPPPKRLALGPTDVPIRPIVRTAQAAKPSTATTSRPVNRQSRRASANEPTFTRTRRVDEPRNAQSAQRAVPSERKRRSDSAEIVVKDEDVDERKPDPLDLDVAEGPGEKGFMHEIKDEDLDARASPRSVPRESRRSGSDLARLPLPESRTRPALPSPRPSNASLLASTTLAAQSSLTSDPLKRIRPSFARDASRDFSPEELDKPMRPSDSTSSSRLRDQVGSGPFVESSNRRTSTTARQPGPSPARPRSSLPAPPPPPPRTLPLNRDTSSAPPSISPFLLSLDLPPLRRFIDPFVRVGISTPFEVVALANPSESGKVRRDWVLDRVSDLARDEQRSRGREGGREGGRGGGRRGGRRRGGGGAMTDDDDQKGAMTEFERFTIERELEMGWKTWRRIEADLD
ncbi:hypothetical protein JCM10212_003419 [Sporobolomyces blumeae]